MCRRERQGWVPQNVTEDEFHLSGSLEDDDTEAVRGLCRSQAIGLCGHLLRNESGGKKD